MVYRLCIVHGRRVVDGRRVGRRVMSNGGRREKRGGRRCRKYGMGRCRVDGGFLTTLFHDIARLRAGGHDFELACMSLVSRRCGKGESMVKTNLTYSSCNPR